MEDEDLEKQIKPEDYWKCRECGQIVEIDFDVCWNCQNNKPEEIENPTIDEILKYQSDDQNQLDVEKYWKCPKCGEIVENDFELCWNCENVISDQIERPSVAEIVNYQSDKKPSGLKKSGFGLIVAGIIVLLFSGLTPISEALGFEKIYYGRLIFGIFFIIIGFFILIIGITQKK